jgi:Flp pilus assembly protein TadD
MIADPLAELGRFNDAIPHYQSFLATNSNARASTGLGIALVAAGRGAEAVEPFRAAAQAEPQNARYRQNLARALTDHGDPAEALKLAQEAVTLDAADPISFDVLGRALARVGRVADARLSFQRALQLDPTYAPALAALRALGR